MQILFSTAKEVASQEETQSNLRHILLSEINQCGNAMHCVGPMCDTLEMAELWRP
jgi:hypothetical protein